VISIESVPIEKHWFEELFGAPAYDEKGSPNALTIEEIRNSTSMLNPGSMPDAAWKAMEAGKTLEIDCETGGRVQSCVWVENNFNTAGEYVGLAASRDACIELVQHSCPFATLANYEVGGQECWCQYGTDMGIDAGAGWENCLLSSLRAVPASRDQENPTPTLYDSDGGFVCSGSLMHSHYVLTSAECAMAARSVVIGASEECPEYIAAVGASVHPGFAHGNDFDIGLVELAEGSKTPPVQLYEGGDLGYNDCHKLSYLTARTVGGTGGFGSPQAMVTELTPITNEDCDIEHEARTGFQDVTKNMLCARGKPGFSTQLLMGGSPLLVPWTGAATGMVQIGVQRTGGKREGPMLYTRVSEMLQWILSAKGLGVHPARMLGLHITDLNLPEGTSVSIYNGHSESSRASWKLDSNCDAGESYIDEGSGAMLLIVEGPAFQQITVSARLEMMGCGDSSKAMMDLDKKSNAGEYSSTGAMPECMAGCEMLQGECLDPVCNLSLTWPNITAMGKVGKAFTGGLGQKAEKSRKGHYGVWACVRDWVEEEMANCGVGPGQLACFRFDERTRGFHFYGSNEELKLVSEESISSGFLLEENVKALLPRAHHEPAPFLA